MRFADAVGVHEQGIAPQQRKYAYRVARIRVEAERGAGLHIHQGGRAAGMQHRLLMTCAGQGQQAGFRFHDTAEQGDEHAGVVALAQFAIQRGEDVAGRARMRGQRASEGHGARHEQSRRDALVGDVAHHDADVAGAEREIGIQIAAYGRCGAQGGMHLDAAVVGEPVGRRDQCQLDLPGNIEFARDALCSRATRFAESI